MKRLLGAVLALLLIPSLAFGQAISQLPSAVTPTGGEYLPMVQAGATVKVTPAQLLAYIAAQGITWSAAQQMDAGLTVLNGLTLSSGNLGVTSGNLTLSTGTLTLTSGTSTFGGLVTAQNGLTVSSGATSLQAATVANGLTVSSGGATVAGDSTFSGQLIDTATGAAPTTSSSSFWVRGGSALYYLINSAGGVDDKVWDFVADASNHLFFRVDSDNNATALPWLTVTRSGATVSSVNFPNGTVEIGGNPVSLYGLFSVSGSACTLSGSNLSFGISGCTRNGAGNYTVNFSFTLSSNPVCTVSPSFGGAFTGFVYTGTSSTSSIQIYETSASGTLGDDTSFNMICK